MNHETTVTLKEPEIVDILAAALRERFRYNGGFDPAYYDPPVADFYRNEAGEFVAEVTYTPTVTEPKATTPQPTNPPTDTTGEGQKV